MAFIPNPPVPYIGPMHGICQNAMIQVAGQIPMHAKWFAVNLQCGPNVNPRDDIALHINPRFEGNMSKIVRNSLQMQQWGLEENFGHFPFVLGQPFEILILVDADHFKLTQRAPSPLPPTAAGQVQASPGYGMPVPQPQPAYAYNPAAAPQATYGMPPQPSQYGMAQPPMQTSGYYPVQQPYPATGTAGLHASSAPMPVPGHSPTAGYKKGLAGAAVGLATGAAAAYGASKLMYPGHGMMGGMGMGGLGPVGMMGMGMHHKKMKKLYKHKFHKPKFHKGFKWHKPKFHKGWHHKGWGSGSSSSSEDSEED